MRVMAMGGGWQKVNGIWRKRQVVPPQLREFLPGKHQGKGTLTRSAKTGNHAEAIKVERREDFDGFFQGLLDCATARYDAAQKDRGIDWEGLAARNDRDDLVSDRDIDLAEARHARGHTPVDPIAAAVEARLGAILKGMGIDIPDKPKAVKPVPFMEIWQSWQERNGTPDTKNTYRTIFCRDAKGRVSGLAKHVGHDNAAAVTGEDIEAYRTAMEQAGKSDPTVHNHLTALSTLYNHAVKKKTLTASPLAGITIGKKPDSEREPYSKEDVARIVLEGRNQPDEIRIPTLIASYGGQRLAEILDAWTQDIMQEDGVWCFAVREKFRKRIGGRIKTTESKRNVPLHPSIDATVLAYRDRIVAEFGEGPLFPRIALDEQNRRANAGGKAIAKWIRGKVDCGGLGITDKDIAPMHSFRHYVRSRMLAAKIDRKVRNAITGHSGGDESEKYEHVEIELRVDAINRLPDPLAG
jgi:integrase